MSRYEKNLGEDTISVGWDSSMNTFFAQVRVNQADDDLRDLPLKLWLGGDFNEFTELAEFLDKLKEKGYTLPASVVSQLRLDQLRGEAIPAELLHSDGWTIKR